MYPIFYTEAKYYEQTQYRNNALYVRLRGDALRQLRKENVTYTYVMLRKSFFSIIFLESGISLCDGIRNKAIRWENKATNVASQKEIVLKCAGVAVFAAHSTVRSHTGIRCKGFPEVGPMT